MGYRKITDLKTIQKILLYALCNFHRICEENNLIYGLFAGTLLGAVRHKGFIPWDDDVDVVMPRDEYEKFVEIIKSGKYSGFALVTPGDKNYAYPFGKFYIEKTLVKEDVFWPEFQVFGAYVDVFPLDNFPDDEAECKRFYEEIRYAEGEVGRITQPYPIFAIQHKSVRQYLTRRLFGTKSHVCERIGEIEKIINKYNCVPTKNFGSTWGRCMLKTRIEKTKFYDRCFYDFEGYKFWGPKDSDWWLTRHFGDYMQLPPPNKRVGRHGYELFADEDILNIILKQIK